MAIHIITDSASDIYPNEAEALGIHVLPLKTTFGDEEFIDKVTMTNEQFFEKLIETDIFPKTSQVTPIQYEEKFEEILKEGDKAIVLALSAELSGCYQSAVIAAEEYPDQVIVIDTENVCVGQRILVELALKLRDQGLSAEEMADELNKQKKKIRLIAMLDTLEYLKKGGRISAGAAFAGTLLSIKPVIAVEEGKVNVLGKARGSKAANNKLHELISAEKGIRFDMPAALAYSGLSDLTLKKYVADHQELYSKFQRELPVTSIGCVIGTHVGPGAIAATFFVE